MHVREDCHRKKKNEHNAPTVGQAKDEIKMNKVMLIGRICNDLKKKYTGDSTVIQVSLAVQRRFKNAKNEYDTDFIQCELWGHNADFLEKNFSKGDMVAFEGAIRNNNYEKDGVKHYSNKIVVESVYFTGSTLMKKKQ